MRYFLLGSRFLELTLFLGLLAVAAPGAAANSGEKVLIQQGEITVTQADFDAELAEIPAQHHAGILASGKRIHQLLDKLFVYRVLAQETRELGLDKDPLLRQQIALAVEEKLGKARLKHLREQALAASPDFEALARERYQANQEQYQLPEQVKVSHILIKAEERSEEEARQLAEKVRKLALAEEKPFAELAVEYSEDPSVERNQGDLGFIARGKTVKPFEEAAFALKQPGNISPVVKSRFGFHIIRLEERQPAQVQPFDQVKEKLVQEAKETYLNKVVQTHLNQIRNAEGIQMNREALQNLKQESPGQRNPEARSAVNSGD
ncbi:PpiC-type peptidyl-prolyl cis-trans isomerase [Nitrosococcus halophilus Nc 4]|uniref:peptidylprolyl isomerase n=1 Tax=Nitrosococcus halophilus (strain Nc4) TaxID=472759 RepID=D5C279_NITHN|nr:peptidylprolyl isomerase [Nitrosococcus halophilus]ADE16667.1 PpiC-type peptidyl-prolyl cis-trans isomerase [Nitrosococcus halophilus Nc 4]